MVRKILFQEWGGKHEPNAIVSGLDRELVLEALEPTKIYVKPLLKTAEEVTVKAAVHITGDAYLKFNNLARFSLGIGFEFNNFKPQPIFRVIQETAKEMGLTITDEEMFRTFNMGWGFAIIVDKTDTDKAMDTLEKADAHPEQIGKVVDKQKIVIQHGDKKLVLA
jgi:phosphoribosylformylglycinamidine cyclo-ligase